jgi:hypothetical protein
VAIEYAPAAIRNQARTLTSHACAADKILRKSIFGEFACMPRVVQTAQTAIVLTAKLNYIECANVESTEVDL